EPRAVRVGPADQAQARGRLAVRRLRAQRAHGAIDAERAVEPASRRHRVRMRSDHHDRVLALAGQVGPDVAGLVDRDRHRQLVEARTQEVARSGPLVRPAHAARAAGPAGEAGQLTQVGEYPVSVDHARTGASAVSERGTNRPWPGCVRISPRSYTI